MNPPDPMTRRQFLRTTSETLAVGAVLAAMPALSAADANNKINLGFIGVGGRGFGHLREFAHMPDVNVVAVADPSEAKRKRAGAEAPGARLLNDYRQVLEMKEVDAVVIATPDHWHAIPTLLACQAGKDVYVEKPLGHNIREGRAMVDAARKHKRVVQLGTQQRSAAHWMEAVKRIQSGELGKISLVRAWNCWGLETVHGDMGNPPDAETPKGLDYDQWLGPAPKRPFNPRHFDFYFYYFWAYSGGMMSAWGVHLFDIISWAMGPALKAVTTTGGKFVLKDARDTPDTAATLFECPDYVCTYELRHANGKQPWGRLDHGIEFYGTKACLWIDRVGCTVFNEDERPNAHKVPGETPDVPHKRNWIECIRSRQRPNSDVELGHWGSLPGHLANISYRVGERIVWDAEKETIPNNPRAEALLGRTYREPYVLPKV
jgi:predicted dehydrogenase